MEFVSIKISSNTKDLLKKYGLHDDNADRVIVRIIAHMCSLQRHRNQKRSSLLLTSTAKKALVDNCPHDLTFNQFIHLLVDAWLRQPDKISGYFQI